MANEDIDLLIAKVNLANLESDIRNMKKPRSKASDTSRMNKMYKPKASPGPAMNTLNMYGAAKPRLGGNANAREDRNVAKKSNFTYSAPKADKAKPNPNRANVRENRVASKPKAKSKSKTTAGFKKGSIGEKAISSFKKAYLGK